MRWRGEFLPVFSRETSRSEKREKEKGLRSHGVSLFFHFPSFKLFAYIFR